jgi:hypothetical protein
MDSWPLNINENGEKYEKAYAHLGRIVPTIRLQDLHTMRANSRVLNVTYGNGRLRSVVKTSIGRPPAGGGVSFSIKNHNSTMLHIVST